MLGNRWRGAIKKTTFTVGEFAYESRAQGAVAIYQTVAEYPGVDAVIEETLDGLFDFKSLIKSGGKINQQEMLDLIVRKFEDSGMTAGQAIALAVTKFPGLISKLLAQGAILHPGETEDDFIHWLEALSVPQVKGLMLDWYRFNLEEVVRPFVDEWKAKAAKAKAEADAGLPLEQETLTARAPVPGRRLPSRA